MFCVVATRLRLIDVILDYDVISIETHQDTCQILDP